MHHRNKISILTFTEAHFDTRYTVTAVNLLACIQSDTSLVIDQLHGNHAADQRLGFRFIDNNPLLT